MRSYYLMLLDVNMSSMKSLLEMSNVLYIVANFVANCFFCFFNNYCCFISFFKLLNNTDAEGFYSFFGENRLSIIFDFYDFGYYILARVSTFLYSIVGLNAL